MPTVSKISQVEWDKHKDRLYALYITDDRHLEEVVERAKIEFGFFASKAQYIRQFGKGKWDFKKNFRKEEWKAISQQVSKRKFRDKDSEVWLKDSLVSSKRLCKEISRYGLHTHNQDENEISLDASSGVVVRTPPAEARPFIDYIHIPWIHFLNLTEPYFQSIRTLSPQGSQANVSGDLTLQLHDAWSVCIARQHGSDLTSVPQNGTQLEVASLPHDMFDDFINLHSDLYSDFQDSFDSLYPPLDHLSPTHLSSLSPHKAEWSMPMVEASIQALSFLADVSGPLTEKTLQSFKRQVQTYQEDLAIGVRDLDSRTVKADSSESLLRLVSFLVYLSSNNLDADEKHGFEIRSALDMLVRWLHDSRTEWVLWQVLDLKTSTTEVFGSKVLMGAAKLGFIETVRKLIDKRVDVNSVEDTGQTALKLAITHNQIDIVRLLLQSGADPMYGGKKYADSTLSCALDGPDRIEMIRILIDHGADVNDDLASGKSRVLSYAVQKRYHAIVRILLEAGAHVNDRSDMPKPEPEPLNAAVGNNDVEMVQILIDAGEDINGRARRFHRDKEQCRWDAYQNPELLATPIQFASLANNAELVQMLLDEGADPCRDVQQDMYSDAREVRYKYVPTALQSAVHHRNAVTVRMLLKAHADVNDRTGHLGPPLAIAAANADLKIVRILLRHGSQINAPAENFRESATALQAAAKRGDLDVVKELLDNGADVNADAGPIIGRTALQAAAEEGDFEMVKFLISIGADLNADPGREMGVTCLQAAVGQGHVELSFFLLDKGAFVNAPAAAGSGGVTALQAVLKLFTKDSDCKEADKAKDHSRFALLETLLNVGADLNSPSSPKKSPSTLAIAVLSGRLDLVHFLLEKGVDLNPCVSYRSPLGEAVAQDDINMVRCLINVRTEIDAWYEIESHSNGGPDLFPFYDFRRTPLHVAAFKGNVEIAGVLLDAGAEIGLIRHRSPSMTALHYAVKGNHTHMVKFLLDKGADPNMFVWRSPLELGLECFMAPNLKVIAALINAGADTNPTHVDGPTTTLFQLLASKNCDPGLAHLLLKSGASVNGTYEGKTVLQSVAQQDTVGMVEILLNAGAYVNDPAGPKSGRTALQHATERGDLEMVKLLLSHGADVNAPAGHNRGITALQGAMGTGSLKMVLTLLEAGADINDAPAAVHGRTALEAAAEWGRLDIVHLLLNNDSEPDTIEARCKRAAKFAEKHCHSIIARDLRQHRPRR